MSKSWEHYHHAARHHEQAAYHFKEAAKYDKAEDRERLLITHTWLTDTTNLQSITMPKRRGCKPDSAIAQRRPPATEQGAKKKSAA